MDIIGRSFMLIMSMSSRVNKVTVYMENLNRYLENL